MARTIQPLSQNARVVAFPHLAVEMTAESDALAIVTAANWINVQGWRTTLGVNQDHSGLFVIDEQFFESYPAFEAMLWCDEAETLSSVALYAARLAPIVIADDTFTSSGSDAVNTAVAHGMLTGDGPFVLSSSTTLPAPFVAGTPYWVEKTAANTFELYTTRELAIAAGGGIVTTDTGTGTHTIADVQSSLNKDDDTQRIYQAFVGDLKEGNNIVVGVQTAHVERIEHSPLDLYYILLATGAGSTTITMRLTPIMGGTR